MSEIDFDSPEVVRILAVLNESYRMNGKLLTPRHVAKLALSRMKLARKVMEVWMNSMVCIDDVVAMPDIMGVRFPKELYEKN
jgi:hypothetical protein